MTTELRPIEHRVATREISFNAEWWPEEFGSADFTGHANGVLYALFPEAKRLVIAVGGGIQLYDTGGLFLSHLAKNQDDNQSLLFETDTGTVRAMDLNKIKA
jgi:hypothetical protein